MTWAEWRKSDRGSIPEIPGPLEAKIMMRFNEISSDRHAIFDEASSPAPSSIFFAYGQAGFGFWIDNHINGNVACLSPVQPMGSSHTLYKVVFSADDTALRIVVDDVEVASCPSSIVPSAVSRAHHLAASPNTTTSQDIDALEKGAILGIMVINTNEPPAHPRDLYRVWNFQSQVLGDTPTGSATSAYVRIVEQEFAFWHFQIHQNSSFPLQKDKDVPVLVDTTGGFPRGVFRTRNYIGRSNWPGGPDNLQGVILGFRLDVEDSPECKPWRLLKWVA